MSHSKASRIVRRRIVAIFAPLVALSSANAATPFQTRVENLAAASGCARVSWKNRGKAPLGYVKGMALSFARSTCRLQGRGLSRDAALVMSRSSANGNTAKDALAYYASTFEALGLRPQAGGAETLRDDFTLGLGLGMRESSGKYCEGWDVAAGATRPSSEAEAGTFQFSYNSIGATPELRKLYDEYRANEARCMLNTFKEGVSCKSQSILGTGAGADFQTFTKRCPAFAAEYAMTTIRVLRKHFGPLNRKEAEVNPKCEAMFHDVERLVNEDPVGACSDLR